MDVEIENYVKSLLNEHNGAVKRAFKLEAQTGIMPTIKTINQFELKRRVRNVLVTIEKYKNENREIPLYLFNDLIPLDYTNNGKCYNCGLPTDARWKKQCTRCWIRAKKSHT